FENPIHLFEVENDLAALDRGSRAITKITTCGDGPYGDFVLVAYLDDALDLLDTGRRKSCGRGVCGVLHRHHDLVVRCELTGVDQYVVIAQERPEFNHGLVKLFLGHSSG